jgi:hypothetical protein
MIPKGDRKFDEEAKNLDVRGYPLTAPNPAPPNGER